MSSLPSQLRKLPIRALIAVAVRCADRVAPSFEEAVKGTDAEPECDSIQQAIEFARQFVSHEEPSCDSGEDVEKRAMAAVLRVREVVPASTAAALSANTAYAVANAANLATGYESTDDAEAVRTAVIGAVTTAIEAATAADERVEAASSVDCGILELMQTGGAEELGRPLSLEEDGPLGPLFPVPSSKKSGGRERSGSVKQVKKVEGQLEQAADLLKREREKRKADKQRFQQALAESRKKRKAAQEIVKAAQQKEQECIERAETLEHECDQLDTMYRVVAEERDALQAQLDALKEEQSDWSTDRQRLKELVMELAGIAEREPTEFAHESTAAG